MKVLSLRKHEFASPASHHSLPFELPTDQAADFFGGLLCMLCMIDYIRRWRIFLQLVIDPIAPFSLPRFAGQSVHVVSAGQLPGLRSLRAAAGQWGALCSVQVGCRTFGAQALSEYPRKRDLV